MPTTNPVPSSDPSDLVFNAEKLDEVVNSPAHTFTDRLGNVRKTIAGVVDPVYVEFESLRGLLNQITWAPGLAIEATPARQWAVVGGLAYVAASNHISGATFAGDLAGGKWLAVDVAQLQADLASSAAGKGAALVGLDHQTVYDVLKNGRMDLSEVARPASQPTAAINAAAGNLNGATAYSVAFVTAYGVTDVSANSNTVAPVNQRVNLTNITVSANPDVIARQIYRTKAGGPDAVLGFLVDTINDNTTTTYTDNISDAALGAPGPRLNTAGGVILKNGQRIANASSHSTAFGMDCHPNNTGYANTAYGAQCMQANTTGYRNSAFGIFALYKNTTGARNSAFGVHALNESTTANDGTAFGYAAAINLTTGQSVTAVGSNALAAQTTADFNTAVGAAAMVLTTTGGYNVSIGANSMFFNTTGQQNTAIGNGALKSSVSGNFNTIIGASAAENATGSTNTAIGCGALLNNLTGSGNVSIGFQSGYYETESNRFYVSNGAWANLTQARTNSLLYGVFGSGPGDSELRINAKVGFNGNAPVGKVAVNGDCSDLPTAIALINQLRAQLISVGIVV